MKIRDWQHAIDLEIERYQYAKDNNIDYFEATYRLDDKDWVVQYPLCAYVLDNNLIELTCDKCLWFLFERKICSKQSYDKAIKRLNKWKKQLEKEQYNKKEESMTGYERILGRYVLKFNRKKLAGELEQKLLDFGFKKIEFPDPNGIMLKLPENSFNISMTVFISYMGFVNINSYDPIFGATGFTCLVNKDTLELVFKDICDKIEEMFIRNSK